MFNWLILAAAVAFSLFVSLLARKLFEHHQHYRSVERIQRQIQMQQFFIHEQMMREEERLHRQMVEQGVMTPNMAHSVMAHGMNPIIQQRNTETEMTEASTPHDFYYKTNFDLSKDGVGFTQNPKLGLSKPRADSVAVSIGRGIDAETVIMNYRRGLFSFGPIRGR